MSKENIMLDKTIIFAKHIMLLYRRIKKVTGFELSRLLLKSGTSIRAKLEEAQVARSKKDFYHKTTIAYERST